MQVSMIYLKNMRKISSNVKNIIDYEKKIGLDKKDRYLNFKKDCELSKLKLVKKLEEYKNLKELEY